MHKNLTELQKSLERSCLSRNTVKVYLVAVYTYYNIYKEVNAKNLDAFKQHLEFPRKARNEAPHFPLQTEELPG